MFFFFFPENSTQDPKLRYEFPPPDATPALPAAEPGTG